MCLSVNLNAVGVTHHQDIWMVHLFWMLYEFFITKSYACDLWKLDWTLKLSNPFRDFQLLQKHPYDFHSIGWYHAGEFPMCFVNPLQCIVVSLLPSFKSVSGLQVTKAEKACWCNSDLFHARIFGDVISGGRAIAHQLWGAEDVWEEFFFSCVWCTERVVAVKVMERREGARQGRVWKVNVG